MDEYQIGEIARASDGNLYRFKGGEAKDRSNWEPVESEKPSVIGGVARAAGQGATFGFSDEMLGGLSAAGAGIKRAVTGEGPTAGEAYSSTVESERAKQKAFAEEYPKLNVASEIGGGVVGALAGGAALRGAGLVGKAAAAAPAVETGVLRGIGRGLLRGTAEGAGYGGLAGAGSAEGGVGERARGAVRGAAGGAAVGGTLGAVIGGAKPVATAAIDAFNIRPQASSKLTNALGIESVEGRANRTVLDAMNREGTSVGNIRRSAIASPDKPLMIAESGMPGGELETAFTKAKGVPASTRAQIATGTEARAAAAPARIQTDLERRAGINRVPTFEQSAKTVEERALGSKPLYEAAYKVGAVKDPEIVKLLQRPSGQKAVERAMKIAADEGDDAFAQWDPRILTPPQGAAATKQGMETGFAHPTVKMLDYVKQALDAMLPEAKAAAGGVKTKEYRAISGLKDELLSKLDAKVPEYKAARDYYAGKSALLNAGDLATELFDDRSSYDEIANALKSMSADEAKAFRSYGVDDLLQRAGNQSPDRVADWIAKHPNRIQKLRLLFNNPNDADAFLHDLKVEQRISTPPIPGAGQVGGESHYLPYPTGKGLAVWAMRNLMRRPSAGVTERTGNEVAGLLSAGLNGPQEKQAALRRLTQYSTQKPPLAIGRAIRRGTSTAAGIHGGG